MKKTVITLVVLVLVTLSVQAQVNALVLSDNHVMVHLESGPR